MSWDRVTGQDMEEGKGQGGRGTFARTVMELLDRTEYRRCVTAEDKEAVGRLRLKAYRADSMVSRLIHSVHDPLDDAPNAHVFAVLVGGVPVGTLRINVITRECTDSFSMEECPGPVSEFLEFGPAIEPARFAADPDHLGVFPHLPYVTLRLAGLAAMHFNAASVVILAREDHAPFYRRVYGAKLVAGPFQYKEMKAKGVLMRVPVAESWDGIIRRHPFFDGTNTEGRLLFGPFASPGHVPLSVTPTARLAEAKGGMTATKRLAAAAS